MAGLRNWFTRFFLISTRNNNIYEYPLRDDKYGKLKLLLYFVILPAIGAAALNMLLGIVIAKWQWAEFDGWLQLKIFFCHAAILTLFSVLLWVPEFLAVKDWPEPRENRWVMIKNVLTIALFVLLFPHEIVGLFFAGADYTESMTFQIIYWSVLFSVIGGLFWFIRRNHKKSAFYEIQMGKAPRQRRNPERSSLYESLILIVMFLGIFFIELWALSNTTNQKINRCSAGTYLSCTSKQLAGFDIVSADVIAPETLPDSAAIAQPSGTSQSSSMLKFAFQSFNVISEFLFSIDHQHNHLAGLKYEISKTHTPEIQEEKRDNRRLFVITWICIALFCTILYFLTAGISNRMMKNILIPVTFQERDVLGILMKTKNYFYHFWRAMIAKYTFLLFGSLGISVLFLLTPVLFLATDHPKELGMIIQIDVVVLIFGIFLAWISPLINALIQPDITFGEYFNHRIADHLMQVQGHIGLMGIGNLGKRVLDREIKLLEDEQLPHPKKRQFVEIVTPDLRLELVCSSVVVVERSPEDVLYSSENQLLGKYGVVGARQANYRTKDLQGNVIYLEKRSLVPVLIGEANEPFVFSRGNLERARLLISTIPDWESVQHIFEHANLSKVPAIICVGSSNQITYYTYRARHRQIVLVYPKHNQGDTLGFRLWATVQKVRAIRNMRGNVWPKILIVGNNKSNHFMIETLWSLLPVSAYMKETITRENLKFVVLTDEGTGQYPSINDGQQFRPFGSHMLGSYFSGSRLPFPLAENDNPLNPEIKVQIINDVDVAALEECLDDFRPDILMVNHEDVEKSSLVLMRFIRALERLKVRYLGEEKAGRKTFELPIILSATTRGDEREQLTLGDSSRFYDAICRMHNEKLASDMSYPAHARFDHFSRELHGETITDSHSDAAEMIAGARRSFMPHQANGEKNNGEQSGFVESSACLPNTPRSLADYTARLARLTFDPPVESELSKLWQITEPALPAFQYLQHIKLDDPDQSGFMINGYATLIPTNGLPDVFASTKGKSLTARMFVTDGRKYVENVIDPLEGYPESLQTQFTIDVLDNIRDPKPPTVTDVLRRVAKQDRDEDKNTISEFTETLLDTRHDGKFACPSMNICRIAAYQNYVAAGNNRRLGADPDIADGDGKPSPAQTVRNELWHARNYACCTEMLDDKKLPAQPTVNPANARIFVCCQDGAKTGMMAQILNALQFRKFPKLRVTYRLNAAVINKFRSHSKSVVLQRCADDLQQFIDDQQMDLVNEDVVLFKAKLKEILGAENFTRFHERLLNLAQRKEDNWRINIDYFSHISCQNSYFSLNRLFGIFENQTVVEPENGIRLTERLPLNVIRILPIGEVSSAKQWYFYARALHQFLNALEDEIPEPYQREKFIFYWFDENRQSHVFNEDKLDEFVEPQFDAEQRSSFPILIVIKRDSAEKKQHFNKKYDGKEKRPGRDEDVCRICYRQKRRYDCSKMRVWI
ncbi:MAG: hypothetical protein KDH98_02025 [Calditrichaeota bacterium]|nr:hypothetical protein [Calditrichota bacterium]